MIDTWYAESTLSRLDLAIGFPRDEGVSDLIDELHHEISSLDCGEEHCEDSHGDLVDPDRAERYLRDKLSRVKLGLYREEHDGDLRTILEEIERRLR